MFNSKSKYKPPFLAAKLMELILPQDAKEYLLGDFESIYNQKREDNGRSYAFFWYWFQIIANAPRFIFTSLQWGIVMYKNYLKVTLRNLARNKLFSAINIGGLAIGLTAFGLILLFMISELSYDKFFKDSERLYKLSNNLVVNGQDDFIALTPPGWAKYLKKDFPEIEESVLMSVRFEQPVIWQEKRFSENVYYSTKDFFKVLSYDLISGDPETALRDPNSLVISSTLAKKLFGTEDAMNKVVQVDDENGYKITGVMRDVPKNSSLKFSALISMSTTEKTEAGRERLSDMIGSNFLHYFKFRKNADVESFGLKIKDHFKKYGEQPEYFTINPFIEKVADIYLYSKTSYNNGEKGSIKHLYIMGGVAGFILLMAGINFTNLTTSSSIQKAKEIGIRKVNGGNRGDIIKQLMGDSVIVAFISFAIAIVAIPFLLSFFNDLSGKHFIYSDIFNLKFILILISVSVFTGLTAGVYPSLYLSAFQPVKILRGEITKGKASSNFRKALVVFQFVTSVVLIITTFILSRQLHYLKFKDVGFKKENVVVLPLNNYEIKKQCETLKTQLMGEKTILNASVSSRMMGSVFSGWSMSDNKSNKYSCTVMFADENYVETLNLKILKGRELSLDYPTDKEEGFLVNEKAVKILGYDDPIGKPIQIGTGLTGKIIGVMKDFNFQSLENNIEPLVVKYYLKETFTRKFINIKIAGGQTEEALAAIKKHFIKFSSEDSFNPVFLDDHLNSLYKDQEKLGRVINVFSVLAVIIGCLGLFGLSAFATMKRKKEVGIRKVLGSSELEITLLLVKDFAVLVLIAIFIAVPVSYYIGEMYLNGFPYRIDVTADVFIYSGIIAFLIATITVGYHSLKAAFSNPIDSIKYE